ncbi:ferredoxin reductase [Pseudonocardia alaniniphila]|uniref:Ferredoxin reductase n=1 Tax=Pseudonocardia alaniniphila TaxID=75291 RepID=A0ABS9TQU1_9PSEU|nr:ferredoxin reductase [Pseudonocardia alaniniphila]MCH6170915.1 ferredoxin reductase [Pseudonocardia alaniniphila]
MERRALLRRLTWQTGTVVELVTENAHTRTIALDVPGWVGHHAGQHVDVRLTAEDGYQAQRSYSIASAPEEARVDLTVERLPDGEVSPYLVDELRKGDALELRGPIGGYFVWREPLGGPLLLIAGGSGIVPIQAMLRHHRAIYSTVPIRLVYSARNPGEFIYRSELMMFAASDEIDVNLTFTREQPPGWNGYGRRIDRAMLMEAGWSPDERPLVYICGPTAFVETASELLVAIGHEPGRIRTERFGGTGQSS